MQRLKFEDVWRVSRAESTLLVDGLENNIRRCDLAWRGLINPNKVNHSQSKVHPPPPLTWRCTLVARGRKSGEHHEEPREVDGFRHGCVHATPEAFVHLLRFWVWEFRLQRVRITVWGLGIEFFLMD